MGVVNGTSEDGCTASIIGDVPTLVRNNEIIEVDADAIAAIAPDGQSYIALNGRDAEYVDIDDGNPVRIGRRLAVVHFGER